MKIAIKNIAGFGAALLLALPIAVCAQGMAQQQSQQTQQGQSQQTPPVQQPGQAAPATPAQPAPVDPAEESAFKQFRDLNTTDAKVIVTSGEDFMKKYPSSRYSGAVYSRLTSAYMQLGDTDHMFAAGNKALAVMPE